MTNLVRPLQILLADDDNDDILLFREALEQLLLPVQITTVCNGEELMQLLDEPNTLPDVLFLDLNMPLKNGMECLSAIKQMNRLKMLPIIIFSTSSEAGVADQLYEKGAWYYIRKPNNFPALKKVIGRAMTLTSGNAHVQPPKDTFVLSS